jgi:hypothetical protein
MGGAVLAASRGIVIERLVDERYVYQAAGGWLDIATGEAIDGSPIDFSDRHPRAAGDSSAPGGLQDVVDRLLRAADTRDAVGICTMHLSIGALPPQLVMGAAAAALRPLGFVAVRAAVTVPETILSALTHRHVAVFACEGDWGAGTNHGLTSWIRALAAHSPRAHLVVLLQGRRAETPFSRASIARERSRYSVSPAHRSPAGQTGSCRAARADLEAKVLIASGDLARAGALIQGVRAELIAQGRGPGPRLIARWGRSPFLAGPVRGRRLCAGPRVLGRAGHALLARPEPLGVGRRRSADRRCGHDLRIVASHQSRC